MTTIVERSISEWRESLQPRFTQFLTQLTVQQLEQLRSMKINTTTRKLIKSLCVDMISIMTSVIHETFVGINEASGTSAASGVPQEQSRPESDTQVRDVIINMFVDERKVSPEIRCESTEEVYRLVREEIDDRVSLKFKEVINGKSRKTKKPLVSKKFKGRLKTIVKHVVRVLNRSLCCAASLPLCSPNTSSGEASTSAEASKSVEASSSLEASTSLDMSLSDKVASDEEPQPIPAVPAEHVQCMPQEAAKDWQSMATDVVRLALEELELEIHTMGPLDGFSKEERDLIQSSISDDSSLRASDIVQVAMEESTSETETRSCWQGATRWVQSFCANRFAQSSILRFVSELRKKYRREEPREELSELMDGVDQLLDDIVPSESRQDQGELYQAMVQNISGEKEQVVSERLSDLVSHHVGPDPDNKLDFESDLQTSVDSFLQRLKRWLREQVLLTKSGRDSATEALQKVQDMMLNGPATAEASSPQEGDSEGAVPEEAAASCSCWLTAPKPVAAAADASPEPAAAEASPEPAAAEASPEPAAAEASPEPVAETKTSQGWETHDYKALVMTLVNSITKKARSWMLKDTPELIAALTQKLCAAMADCDVSVKPTERHLKRITKAVKKDLVKQWENKNMVENYLLTGEDDINQIIVASMKKHLTAPKKKSFFSWKK
ncbi:uncharacterized protein V6R79_025595 [Siganus canaliculatus]